MKSLKRRLPLILLLSKVLIVTLVLKANAQEPNPHLQQELHQDLTYCAKQFNYTPVQMLQLKHLKQQQNLSQQARFQNYLKILTPAQQQELAQCTKTQMKQSITTR
jgi:DNA-binding MltR family transcriptional regulator